LTGPLRAATFFSAGFSLSEKSMKVILLATLVAAFATSSPALSFAQDKQTHPAFTLVTRVTATAPDGRQVVMEAVRHVSSGGGVRHITKREDGSVSNDYVFEKGRGGFFINHEGKRLVKSWGIPSEASGKPLPTAESLRADPNFLRTEEVLGHTAYVIRDVGAGIGGGTGKPAGRFRYERYYAPELGRTPLKEVQYSDDKIVSIHDPVSVTFGEPDAALMKAPDYEVAPMGPISGGVLNGKAIEKPSPVWPKEAREVQGTVTVQVLVDEQGKVIKAKAVSGPMPLRQAAVDAALKARLTPTRLSGEPVKVSGVLTYNFVLK
jgi:TonB family protein